MVGGGRGYILMLDCLFCPSAHVLVMGDIIMGWEHGEVGCKRLGFLLSLFATGWLLGDLEATLDSSPCLSRAQSP